MIGPQNHIAKHGWRNIQTSSPENAVVEVTYSGSNSDLLGIKNGADQTVVLTFQFSPVTAKSLTELMTPGQVSSTSYSGSLSSSSSPPVPEPSSCMLLVTAGLGLLTYAGRRRRRTA